MGFITYFDLLGTRGFCDNSETYYDSISKFNKAVIQTGSLLIQDGQVGVFSDSAYAESEKLGSLLDFLVFLRDRLMSEGLFFNAVVKKGELGIKSLSENASNVFGVAFTNREIADLYIAQTKFKGVGIFIDPSITDAEIKEVGYSVSNCIYMGRYFDGGKEKYAPVAYRDISLKTLEPYSVKCWDNILEILLCSFYESYVKNPKYGAYYISLFSNFIRSFSMNLSWDMKKKEFSNAPTIVNVIINMVSSEYENLRDLPGLECLAFVMLDMVYWSEILDEHDKNSITKMVTEFECIKHRYLHDLNSLPQNVFSSNLGVSFRERFISYCQKNSANDFVERILPG